MLLLRLRAYTRSLVKLYTRKKSRSRKKGSRALRTVAWAAVACGVAAPLLRKKLKLPPVATIVISATAPLGLAVATPRSRLRDAAIYGLQMWAYIATYEMPNDDPEKLMRRVRVDYPIKCDRMIGGGKIPTSRIQPGDNPGHLQRKDFALAWVHWLWYLFPHGSLVYTMFRRPERFPGAATMMAAVYDLGSIIYWAVPTAPPWYAADQKKIPPVRRIMVEAGEQTWGGSWKTMYEFLGGNPVAAMPSLHFATSVMGARILAESGPVAGAFGWSYALTLGYGLVYLGEHYVTDLIVGFAFAETIRRIEPDVSPALSLISDAIQTLEVKAKG